MKVPWRVALGLNHTHVDRPTTLHYTLLSLSAFQIVICVARTRKTCPGLATGKKA